jgi:hypothetical protein
MFFPIFPFVFPCHFFLLPRNVQVIVEKVKHILFSGWKLSDMEQHMPPPVSQGDGFVIRPGFLLGHGWIFVSQPEIAAHGCKEIGIVDMPSKAEVSGLMSVGQNDLIFGRVMGGSETDVTPSENGPPIPKNFGHLFIIALGQDPPHGRFGLNGKISLLPPIVGLHGRGDQGGFFV